MELLAEVLCLLDFANKLGIHVSSWALFDFHNFGLSTGLFCVCFCYMTPYILEDCILLLAAACNFSDWGGV